MHRYRRLFVSAVVCAAYTILIPAAAIAQAVPLPANERADEVALEELIRVALGANPELRAAQSRVSAARQRPAQANALEDPMLGVVVRNVDFPEPTVGIEPMSVVGLSFSQALPGAGKRELRKAVEVEGIDVAMARERRVRARLVREVAQAFYELVFVHEAIGIVEQTKTLLADLEKTAEARYAVGDGIQQDVLKAQVEISVLVDRLIQLEEQRLSIENRLNRLMGRSADTAIGPLAPVALPRPSLDLDELQRSAAAFSALLVERDEQIQRQQRSVDLARKDVRADYLVGGSWLHRGSLPDIWQLNLSVSLPIRQSQRQDRAIEEALEELSARRMDRRSDGLAVSETVRDRYLKVDRAIRLIALFRDGIIPQSLLSLESAMAGYSVGEVDFLTVLDNIVTLLTYRLELERETAAYMVALAGIEEHVYRSLGATPADVWELVPGSQGTERGTATSTDGARVATVGAGEAQ